MCDVADGCKVDSCVERERESGRRTQIAIDDIMRLEAKKKEGTDFDFLRKKVGNLSKIRITGRHAYLFLTDPPTHTHTHRETYRRQGGRRAKSKETSSISTACLNYPSLELSGQNKGLTSHGTSTDLPTSISFR